METIRILIAEDEALFSEMLSSTLSAQSELEVVGLAWGGETAIRLAREEKSDAALRIKEERPETGIVILSLHGDRRYVTSLPLVELPGWAYLLKQTVPDVATVIRAIKGSISGMLVLDPAVVASLRPRHGSVVA